MCEFLELSGLSALVGASYGSQYALTVQGQEAVATQAQEQRIALAVGMPPQELAAPPVPTSPTSCACASRRS